MLRSSLLVNDDATTLAMVPTTTELDNNIATTALESSSLFTEDMAHGFEVQHVTDRKNKNGDPCSKGNNDACGNGLICGRYNNKSSNYQCCICTDNDCVLQGQAWCRNGVGGDCSDGNDNNCASGLVCRRYINFKDPTQSKTFSCVVSMTASSFPMGGCLDPIENFWCDSCPPMKNIWCYSQQECLDSSQSCYPAKG